MKKRFQKIPCIIIPVVIMFIMATQAVAASIDLPEPTSNFFVNDFANIIDSKYEQYIQDEAVSLYEKTGAQVVVVTINSLDGESLEEYANALFRKWGIGSAKEDNGVLILVSIGDRMSRIEVGYGLEGALPDGKTGRIQDNYMVPFFRNEDYEHGIFYGFLEIVKEVYNEYGLEYQPAEYQYTVEYSSDGDTDTSGVFPVMLIIILVIIDLIFFRGRITKLLLLAASSGRHSGSSSSYRSGRSGGGGFSGGGGRSGGGGSSRKW